MAHVTGSISLVDVSVLYGFLYLTCVYFSWGFEKTNQIVDSVSQSHCLFWSVCILRQEYWTMVPINWICARVYSTRRHTHTLKYACLHLFSASVQALTLEDILFCVLFLFCMYIIDRWQMVRIISCSYAISNHRESAKHMSYPMRYDFDFGLKHGCLPAVLFHSKLVCPPSVVALDYRERELIKLIWRWISIMVLFACVVFPFCLNKNNISNAPIPFSPLQYSIGIQALKTTQLILIFPSVRLKIMYCFCVFISDQSGSQ